MPDSRSEQEMIALWAAVFGEPPTVTATAEVLAAILVRHLPPAPPYEAGRALADGVEAESLSSNAAASSLALAA